MLTVPVHTAVGNIFHPLQIDNTVKSQSVSLLSGSRTVFTPLNREILLSVLTDCPRHKSIQKCMHRENTMQTCCVWLHYKNKNKQTKKKSGLPIKVSFQCKLIFIKKKCSLVSSSVIQMIFTYMWLTVSFFLHGSPSVRSFLIKGLQETLSIEFSYRFGAYHMEILLILLILVSERSDRTSKINCIHNLT